MEDTRDFTTMLRALMRRTLRSNKDLAKLTGISINTIENWTGGKVQRPHYATDVLKLARALGLDAAEVTYLLTVAGHPRLDALWTQAQQAEDVALLRLLAPWATELESTGGALLPPASSALVAHPPYCGLRTFQEADAAYLFGRDALIARLVAKLQQTSFLAVLGPSGSGKSSVVLAGLIPALKGGALPDSTHWCCTVLKPGARPLDTLAATLAQLQGGDLGSVLALSQQLAADDRALLLASELLRVSQPDTQLLLVIDQFEELWTRLPTEEATRAQFVAQQQRPFLQQLLTTVSAPAPPAHIVITIRADFLPQVAEHAELAQWVSEHNVLVSPMTPAELHDVIIRPAEAAGGHFEPGLIDELIAQVQERVGALPLLEYTLLELWERRTDRQIMTWASYRTLGSVEGALAERANQLLEDNYTPEQQAQLRQLLLRLIQPGEGVTDIRRRVPMTDLVPVGGTIAAVRALLAPLIAARLLTAGHEVADGVATIEVAHEAMIRAWPRLRQWISEARTGLRFQLQLEDATQEWQRSGEHVDLLWGGLRLANAEAWIACSQPLLNAREQAFIERSRVQEQARTDAAEAAQRRELAQAQALAETQQRRAREQARSRLFVGTSALVVAGVFAVLVLLSVSPEARRIAAQKLDELERIVRVSSNSGGLTGLQPPSPFTVKQLGYLPAGLELIGDRYNPGPRILGSVTEEFQKLDPLPGSRRDAVIQDALKQDRGTIAHLLLIYKSADRKYAILFERAAQPGEVLPIGQPRIVSGQPAVQQQGSMQKLIWIDGGTWTELESNFPETELHKIAEGLVPLQPATITANPAHVRTWGDSLREMFGPIFCDPAQEPPDTMLGKVEGQKKLGSISVLLVKFEHEDMQAMMGSFTGQRSVLESAIAALRSPATPMQRLPYQSINWFSSDTPDSCWKPAPEVQGYIAIEVWEHQVNLGYGGIGAGQRDSVIKALEEEMAEITQ